MQMALHIKQGDLFEHALERCIIIHGCNCMGKMQSGFADKLRNIYPAAYTAYKRSEMSAGLRLGEVSTVRYTNDLIIANALTQYRYGRDPDVVYVDYEAVESALTKAAEFAEKNSYPVHMPFIGGGLANGDRSKLLEIFKRVFANVDATLWLLSKEEIDEISS
jgi:O-acetyl-ADP-ribose deacetylase (regulator of RNase III)